MKPFFTVLLAALMAAVLSALLFSFSYAGVDWYLLNSTRMLKALNKDQFSVLREAWRDVSVAHDYTRMVYAAPLTLAGLVLLISLAFRMQKSRPTGSEFATLSEISRAGFLKQGGIFIGRFGGHAYYVWGPHRERGSGRLRLFKKRLMGGARLWIDGDDVGGFMVGPPRSGKGAAVIIPNALLWQHSFVVLDMRGETYEATAGYRSTISRVVRFAPADPDGNTEFYNPLDFIRLDPAQRDIDIRNMAAAIFPSPPGASDPYWVKDARLLFSGFVSYVLETPALEDSKRNIRSVLDIMNSPEETILEFIATLRDERQTEASDYTRRLLLPYTDMSEKQFSGLYGNIRTELTPFLNELVTRATSKSTFDIRSMRQERISLYLDFRVQQIATLGPLFNILITQMMNFLSERMPTKDEHRVLILLDEFQNLGKLENVMAMATILGGYGVPIWFFVQSLRSVDTIYQIEGRENLINAARVQIFFGAQSQGDLRYVSDMLGEAIEQKQEVTRTQTTIFDSYPSRSTHMREVRKPLMRPEQVRTMNRNHCLIIPRGFAPIYGVRNYYFEDAQLLKKAWKPAPSMSGLKAPASPPSLDENRLRNEISGAASVTRGATAFSAPSPETGIQRGSVFAAKAGPEVMPASMNAMGQTEALPVVDQKEINAPASETNPVAVSGPVTNKQKKKPDFASMKKNAIANLATPSETELKVQDALARLETFRARSKDSDMFDLETRKLAQALPDVL